MTDSNCDDAFVRFVTFVGAQLAWLPPCGAGDLRSRFGSSLRSTIDGGRGRLALAVATARGWGAMITGANTNVRHRDVIFHVQTEDSGRANPHIISHLYHGGTILASEKTKYGDKLETSDDVESMVRGLIESQHKEMLRQLKRGEFDATIEERLPNEVGPAKAPAKSKAAKPTSTKKVTPAAAVAATTDTATSTSTTGGLDTATPVPDFDEPKDAPDSAVARAEASPATPGPGDSRGFGEGIMSQKPLDEVILDYLSEKARERVDRTSPKRSGG